MSNRRTTARRRKPMQRYLRLPAFLPVPLRARRDGWTPARQARFIGLLAQTGCVRKAAHMIGLSRESAYRLRRHPAAGSFIAAWTTALSGRTQPRWKFTRDERLPLAITGTVQPRMWRGIFKGVQRKSSDTALLAAIADLDRATAHATTNPLADRQVRALFGRLL
ncbi:hypothetical protein [Croceibacterium mercuriale]|uniref:hypothetical protein n=1 Tax=Croceibacterium mercuriale TaxID=1572751 RepID=UPI00068B63E1|nr:hypothetical protein [Croceibacterium mercuriale]